MRDLSAVCVRVTDVMVRSNTSRQLNEIVTLHIKHVQLALLGSCRSHTSFLAYIYNDLCSLRWCIWTIDSSGLVSIFSSSDLCIIKSSLLSVELHSRLVDDLWLCHWVWIHVNMLAGHAHHLHDCWWILAVPSQINRIRRFDAFVLIQVFITGAQEIRLSIPASCMHSCQSFLCSILISQIVRVFVKIWFLASYRTQSLRPWQLVIVKTHIDRCRRFSLHFKLF